MRRMCASDRMVHQQSATTISILVRSDDLAVVSEEGTRLATTTADHVQLEGQTEGLSQPPDQPDEKLTYFRKLVLTQASPGDVVC